MTIAMYSRTSWREVEPDFTVGQTDGEFAGTIERIDGRFHASTHLGQSLGSFRSSDSAQRALEQAAAHSDAEPASAKGWQLPVLAASLAVVSLTALSAVISL